MASDPAHRPMRLFIAARSRFSEDTMAACVARGVRQIVILGAGLDTFSLRNPHAEHGARVFEVDYPATQAWKRERLRQAGLDLPATLTFAPVDFERQSLAEGLAAAGFRADQPAYFQWLGVVPYLTRDAIVSTLDFIAGISGSEVVFDYGEPHENYPPAMRANLTAIAERAPRRSASPGSASSIPPTWRRCCRRGTSARFEDVTRAELARRYYGDTGGGARDRPRARMWFGRNQGDPRQHAIPFRRKRRRQTG